MDFPHCRDGGWRQVRRLVRLNQRTLVHFRKRSLGPGDAQEGLAEGRVNISVREVDDIINRETYKDDYGDGF